MPYLPGSFFVTLNGLVDQFSNEQIALPTGNDDPYTVKTHYHLHWRYIPLQQLHGSVRHLDRCDRNSQIIANRNTHTHTQHTPLRQKQQRKCLWSQNYSHRTSSAKLNPKGNSTALRGLWGFHRHNAIPAEWSRAFVFDYYCFTTDVRSTNQLPEPSDKSRVCFSYIPLPPLKQ